MTSFAFISRLRPVRSSRGNPCPEQAELSFNGEEIRDLRAWLTERRKSPLRRFLDELSAFFLKSVLRVMEQCESMGRLLGGVHPVVWMLGSFLLSTTFYAHRFGWALSTGFLLLLVLHEFGHILAARHYRVRTSWPIFIPFVGAIIDLKECVIDPWKNAVIGLAGPVFGTTGALATYVLFRMTGIPCLAEIAFLAMGMNLFNMIPLGCLDGGHAAAAVSRWIWIAGYLLMGLFAWWSHAPMAWITLVVMFPMILGIFRRNPREREVRITALRKFLIGATWLLLSFILAGAMLAILGRDILPAFKNRTSSLLPNHSSLGNVAHAM